MRHKKTEITVKVWSQWTAPHVPVVFNESSVEPEEELAFIITRRNRFLQMIKTQEHSIIIPRDTPQLVTSIIEGISYVHALTVEQ